MLQKLANESEICLDTETTSLNSMQAKLVGIGFAASDEQAYYIPFNADLEEQTIREALFPFLQEKHFFGHNIKYDLHVLSNWGVNNLHVSFDTMVASYMLAPHENRHNLDDLCIKFFNHHKVSYKELVGTGKKEKKLTEIPIETVAQYCAEDVHYTLLLKNLFHQQLQRENLLKAFLEIELPLIAVLLRMERNGIFLNPEILKTKSVELKESIHKLAHTIYDLCGEEFNINSPKQLSEILFTKLQIPFPGKKVSTRADILEGLKNRYPIAGLVLEYRFLENFVQPMSMLCRYKLTQIRIAFTAHFSKQSPQQVGFLVQILIYKTFQSEARKDEKFEKRFFPKNRDGALLPQTTLKLSFVF